MPSKTKICGEWSDLAPMQLARKNFAAASGPDMSATNPVSGLDNDPRVYVCGGIIDEQDTRTNLCEKYDPNTDSWSEISSLPEPLGNSSAAFAPDYGNVSGNNLGYLYVVGDNIQKLFQYNIRADEWSVIEPTPPSITNATIQYLDDIGGPLAQLFTLITEVDLPPCTDGQTLWIVGGDGTEKESWYLNMGIDGLPQPNAVWNRGPTLPLFRQSPLIGRVFWRDTGITSFGVSNCASIIVAGGRDQNGKARKEIQLLIRNRSCNWEWISKKNNPSEIPDDLLTLQLPVTEGAFGTEPWPETLVTGGRPILFGGKPSNRNRSLGSTQFGQFRFFNGRYQRDPRLSPGRSCKSAWNVTTGMPGNRIFFRALPLSQTNSSRFGGNRMSRFSCVGGVNTQTGQITNRNQLFELPIPGPFTEIVSLF